jgi:membrane protein DedA with SNARE-associated domain
MHEVSVLVQHFPYLGLFILLILGGIGLPFPEDATLILCGFLISTHMITPFPALSVVYSGILLADIFLYLIGRKYGRMIVTHQRFHKILSPERFSELEDKFNKKGISVILIGRHLVGLRAQIFLVSGIMRMPVLKFIIADAVSSVFTIAVMVVAGYMGGNSLQIIKKDITRIEHIGIIVFIILLLFYLIFRYLKFIYKK